MIEMSDAEKAAFDAGLQYGMKVLEEMPKDNVEANITGVLMVFWGALWGTFGTDYARGFIERQLNGMESNAPHDVIILRSPH